MVKRMTDIMKAIFLHFFLLVSDSFAVDSGSYVWYLLPKAGNRLHGYQQIKRQSFESELLPGSSFVSREDGVNGVWIPANQKIVLGDFASGCFSNVSICPTFTVSFLFKINESLSENETIHLIHEMPLDDGDFQVQFSVSYNGSLLSGHATVSRGNNKTETFSALTALLNTWNHAAMVYEEPGLLYLLINGTNVTDRVAATNYMGSLSPVQMTLGSLNSSRGFFMSYLKVVPNALNETEIQDLRAESWNQATSPTPAEVFFNQSVKIFNESVGEAEIVVNRAGNPAVASLFKLTLSNDTVVPSDVDLIVSPSDELFFQPGETVKRLNFIVDMDTIPEDDVKFNLTLSSDGRVTSVTGNTLQIIIEDDDIDDCDPGPCQNNATCRDLHLDYACDCAPGYEGRNCSNDIDDCDPSPCENGATCRDLLLDYVCDCAPGFDGRNCSNDIDECANRPCQNGGICTDHVADYNCTCQAGFTGKNCDIYTYLWYLFPVGAKKVYGYDPETNRSFASEQVPDGTSVKLKDGIRSLHIRPGTDVILGDFAASCLQNVALCDSFTVSFLVYIGGDITVAGNDVQVLLSKSLDRGAYQIEFTVKRVTPASAEGHVFVVGLNSTNLLERKGEFPGTNQWVHVAIVYSMEAVDFYMNSVAVTNPTTTHAWTSSGSQVQLTLGSTGNTNNIFLSYFQIVRGNLSEQEIRQLDMESRTQAANTERAIVQLLQDNLVESEGVRKFVIPFQRSGNLFIASVLSYFSRNGSALSGVDFASLTDQESVIRPGEKYGSVGVNVTDDALPEMNEPFRVTIFSPDNITTFTRTDVNITILNDDVDDCDPSPCQNNATCRDLHLDYACDCAPGYEGRNCSNATDECASRPCQNATMCQDLVLDYMCVCSPGFTGKNCSINIDDCAGNPCENGGTCNDLLNSFNCSCAPGFAGNNCSHDAFLWYLFPTGAARIYGYDSETGVSFDSNLLHADVNVEIKDSTYGLCIPMGGEVILGDFASQCLGDPSICETFTISFLTIVNGPVGSGDYVHVLYSTPIFQGRYHVQFTVTRTSAGLEGQAYIVGGTSTKLLERKGRFPALNQWVYVAIVYSKFSEVIELYLNSLKTSNPLFKRQWNNSGSNVSVSLGSRNNTGQFCVSYLQITKVALSDDEVQQLEKESRAHAMEPFMVEAGFNMTDIITEEGAGSVTVPVKRTGNQVIASVLMFSADNITAKSSSDFKPVPMEEVVIKPGQNYGQLVIGIEDDHVPESNETFLLTVASSDNVTFITGGNATVKILDDDIDECAFGPCQNNATCSDRHLDYVCTCSPGAGYEGKNCSENINDCAESPCQHNGTCMDLLNDYNCTCAPGYQGKNCSEDIDECESAPCQINGTCENLLADYNCTCIPGFTGRDCETNINDCAASPCQNSGTCVDLLNDYRCVCAVGYRGENCSEDIDECSENGNPCKNEGNCTDEVNGYRCLCTDGFEGQNCTTASASKATVEDDNEVLFIVVWVAVAVVAVVLLATILGIFLLCKLFRRSGWSNP